MHDLYKYCTVFCFKLTRSLCISHYCLELTYGIQESVALNVCTRTSIANRVLQLHRHSDERAPSHKSINSKRKLIGKKRKPVSRAQRGGRLQELEASPEHYSASDLHVHVHIALPPAQPAQPREANRGHELSDAEQTAGQMRKILFVVLVHYPTLLLILFPMSLIAFSIAVNDLSLPRWSPLTFLGYFVSIELICVINIYTRKIKRSESPRGVIEEVGLLYPGVFILVFSMLLIGCLCVSHTSIRKANCENRNLTLTANLYQSSTSQTELIFNSTPASSHEVNLSSTCIPSDSSTSELFPATFADKSPSAAEVFALRVYLCAYLLCTGFILTQLVLDMCLTWKRHWQHEKAPRLDGVLRRLIGTRCCLRGRLAPLCYALEVVRWAFKPCSY